MKTFNSLLLAGCLLLAGAGGLYATSATDPAVIAELMAVNPGSPSSGSVQSRAWVLKDEVKVDRQGVYLSTVLKGISMEEVPLIRLAEAPALGRVLTFSRAQIAEEVARQNSDFKVPAWAGAERVRISRKVRVLTDGDFRQMLTTTLQSEQARDKGELDITLTRSPGNPLLPDEPLELRVIDMPRSGLSSIMSLRCEIRCGGETVATVSATFQARLMRDVWVARSGLPKGQPLQLADLGQEKRDVLTARDALASLPVDDGSYEIADNIMPGALLTTRSFHQRPVVKRGNTLEAMFEDGSMTISVKVEAMEDGLPGQVVRVRNLKTQREFRGKVKNEQTVLVQL